MEMCMNLIPNIYYIYLTCIIFWLLHCTAVQATAMHSMIASCMMP